MKNKGHWLENERHDIDEDYQEALYKIKKSQLPNNLKELLRDQAEENRSLALEQAEDRAELMKKAQSRARRIPRRIYERQIQPQSGQGSHEHLVTQNAGYKTPPCCVGII